MSATLPRQALGSYVEHGLSHKPNAALKALRPFSRKRPPIRPRVHPEVLVEDDPQEGLRLVLAAEPSLGAVLLHGLLLVVVVECAARERILTLIKPLVELS